MSLTLPIEDISRLRVFAHLNKSGLPVLSLTMRASTSSSEPSAKPPSGIYINFERTNENGCWSLQMKTIFEEENGEYQDNGSQDFNPLVTNPQPPDPLDFSTFPSEIPDSNALMLFGAPFETHLEQDTTILPPAEPPNVPIGTNANQPIPTLPYPLIPEPEHLSFSSSSTTQIFTPQSDILPIASSSSTSSPSNPVDYDQLDSPSVSSPGPGPERTRSRSKKPKRKLPCTMGCSEQFSRQHDRFRHEVSKHGLETKWVCDKCRGFFSSEKSLNVHKCSTGTRWRIAVA
ncbi:hypothetical protein VNI00_014643 [Paramarasmius palmivorus]|uniref:C2H2-type domain-containing protein n=1 Tax=Paramarasmius palmivorus TaxID=297713 RepID=A0AAW0BT40_9AGAR